MPEWEPNVGRHPRVDEQVLEVLAEGAGTLAFNGLRRALKVHPESLVRALRRLEREGMVQRSENGYSLREATPMPAGELPKARTVASVDLPPGTSSHDLLGRLAGRWLGSLRWLGVYERPGDPWLVWTVGTGPGHAILSVRRGSLRVLTDAPAKDARAVDATFALLARALETIREGGSRGEEDLALATFARDLAPSPLN